MAREATDWKLTQDGVMFVIDPVSYKESLSSIIETVDQGSGFGAGQPRWATVIAHGPDVTDVQVGDRVLVGDKRLPIFPDPVEWPDVAMIKETEILMKEES